VCAGRCFGCLGGLLLLLVLRLRTGVGDASTPSRTSGCGSRRGFFAPAVSPESIVAAISDAANPAACAAAVSDSTTADLLSASAATSWPRLYAAAFSVWLRCPTGADRTRSTSPRRAAEPYPPHGALDERSRLSCRSRPVAARSSRRRSTTAASSNQPGKLAGSPSLTSR
jgi:hypothetical protein